MDIAFKILSILIIIIAVYLFLFKKKLFYPFVFISLIVFPKVNLITVSGSSTGIRYDDFLILITLILGLFDIRKMLSESHKLRIIHFLIVIWVFIGLLSTIINILVGTVSNPLISVLTSLRKYEYFVCVFVGVGYFSNSSYKSFIKTIRIISIVFLVIALAQRFQIIGGFISGSYKDIVSPIAVFNGPYEYACYSCLLLTILLYDTFKRSAWSFIFSILVIVQILLSASRSGIVLSLIILLLMSLAYSKGVFAGLIVVGGLSFVVLASTTNVFERFLTLDINSLINVFNERIANGDYFAALEKLPTESMFPNINSDLSFYVRTTKWGAAINGFTINPILGYGPGQLSVLDGSYVKVLCEGGILSFIVFVCLMAYTLNSHMVTKNSIGIWVLLSVLVFGLFIDIFDSSKVMELFWMISGFSFLKQERGEFVNYQKEYDCNCTLVGE